MKYALLLAASLLACKGEAGPAGPGGNNGGGNNNGGVDLVVGSWCTTEKSSAVADGQDWRVTVYWNETTYRYVTGNDGIVRQQEVRSCRSGSCSLIGGVATMSAAAAIAYCFDALNP